MNETENKRDTYNVEKMYQINQQQAESIHSNQSLEINQNGNNKEKKKPFWKKAWIVISAIIAALAGLAAVFGKNLSDFFGL